MAKNQKNKYLEDIGLKEEYYGTNFCNGKNDKRQKHWAKQRKKYGFDDRELWCLDVRYIEWLYSRCMMFKKKALKVFDLSQNTINYDGIEYNAQDALNIIIEVLKDFLIYYEKDENTTQKNTQKDQILYDNVIFATHLWAELLPFMWW